MRKFKLNFLHLCDTAFFSQEGKLNIIGVFDVVNLKNISSKLLKAVLVGNISVLHPKISKIKFGVKLVNGTNQSIDLKIPPMELAIPKQIKESEREVKVGFVLEIGNIKFPKKGKYKFKVSVNGQNIGEVGFEVKVNSRESRKES